MSHSFLILDKKGCDDRFYAETSKEKVFDLVLAILYFVVAAIEAFGVAVALIVGFYPCHLDGLTYQSYSKASPSHGSFRTSLRLGSLLLLPTSL